MSADIADAIGLAALRSSLANLNMLASRGLVSPEEAEDSLVAILHSLEMADGYQDHVISGIFEEWSVTIAANAHDKWKVK